MRVKSLLFASAVALTGSNAMAAPLHCKDVDTSLTHERSTTYARLVAASVTTNPAPSKISIETFMEAASWAVVYASLPDSEPGFFFFKELKGKPEFQEVWGGYADDGEGPELIRWAEKLGAPKPIAA